MSTRSYIAVRTSVDALKEGEPEDIRAVYCHWDGYPSNNGKLLLENWDTKEKLYELLEYGDMSCLGSTLSQCEFYGRDRGETGTDFKYFESMEEFLEACREDYTYLYDCAEEQWYYRSWNNPLKPLTMTVCREK